MLFLLLIYLCAYFFFYISETLIFVKRHFAQAWYGSRQYKCLIHYNCYQFLRLNIIGRQVGTWKFKLKSKKHAFVFYREHNIDWYLLTAWSNKKLSPKCSNLNYELFYKIWFIQKLQNIMWCIKILMFIPTLDLFLKNLISIAEKEARNVSTFLLGLVKWKSSSIVY